MNAPVNAASVAKRAVLVFAGVLLAAGLWACTPPSSPSGTLKAGTATVTYPREWGTAHMTSDGALLTAQATVMGAINGPDGDISVSLGQSDNTNFLNDIEDIKALAETNDIALEQTTAQVNGQAVTELIGAGGDGQTLTIVIPDSAPDTVLIVEAPADSDTGADIIASLTLEATE